MLPSGIRKDLSHSWKIYEFSTCTGLASFWLLLYAHIDDACQVSLQGRQAEKECKNETKKELKTPDTAVATPEWRKLEGFVGGVAVF